MMPSHALTGMLADEVTSTFKEWGEPAFRAKQVLEWLYEKRVVRFDQMSNLGLKLRQRMEENFSLRELQLTRHQGSKDTTQKLLFRLRDGRYIESVIIPANPALYGEKSDRHTLCVSTQVGCAMACKFCASGLDGLTRNLQPHEIVEQILHAEAHSGERMDNLVFMGMGEPLANLKNTLKAIQIINAPWGVGIGARHITLSTSGLVPQIRQLAEQPLQLRLAVSLHGATDEVREQIMPVNRKYPIDVLFAALRDYTQLKKQIITLEYILIEGVNDMPEQAVVLARRAQSLRAKVNLIPYNTVEGLPWKRPSEAAQNRFHAILEDARVPTTLRREKGHDIDAACGQLRLKQEQAEMKAPTIR